MDKQQARKIIAETFENPFDKVRFTGFIKDLLNHIDEGSFIYKGNYIPDAYKQYIKTLERIGKFSDGENSFDILVITLQKETSLERARTMQRNFIAWYLNGSRGGAMKEAALVAYVSPDQADWRFSLVKMDYTLEKGKTGKMKVKEEFTPARRWSFLVGENERSHTAQSRLVNILADDEHAPTLAELEKAFDIETVTKEFFLKYRELFLRTREALDKVVKKDPKIKADFEAKSVDTVNFAKKLLGQIVFLYFLQKKGWFGVGRDDDWGTGSKHFLRSLFAKKHGDYKNFFNDILEPLFYEALRIDRSHDDHYYSRFDCKIPFLNGGLFDPIGNYDWVHTDINLPNDLFSNSQKTQEGDIGDGILDVFDRYNFTVREDEPLEKEVAIDPELLGKAYEKFNAIRPDNFNEFTKALKSGKKGEENKFNKKFGVYYTPREIVHYMCKQSLIQYLGSALDIYKKPVFTEPASQLNLFGDQKPEQRMLAVDSDKPVVSMQDIEDLIEVGEMITEHEATALIKQEKIKNGIQKSTEYTALLSDSIRKNAKLIDDLLADITVCDPAVGSGAFPVGMMNEIVRARNVLSVFLNGSERSDYKFKRRCIEHSLYGVDIDTGAVEVAKLRLWLSLVVDEEDIKNIKPLPNLDYRIMQGNSLISEFMGIDFDSEQRQEETLLKNETDELIEQFQREKDEFLNESNVTQKARLKEDVENLLVKIFETKLKTQQTEYFNRLKNIENKYSVLRNEDQRKDLINQEKEKLYKEFGFDLETAEDQLKEFTSGRQIKPFFLWNLYFSEVFHNKGGFDVVIANPPYVRQEAIKPLKPHLEKAFGAFYCGTADIYTYFYKCGIDLLRPSGHLCFIAPNKFMRAGYGKNTRALLTTQVVPRLIIDFGDLPIFDATTYPSIILVEKRKPAAHDTSTVATFREAEQLERLDEILGNISFSMPVAALGKEGWNLEQPEVLALMEKLKSCGTPLGEYVKGRFYYGIKTGLNDAFVIDAATREKLISEDPKSEELIKPWLRGRDIGKWKAEWDGLYLINIPSSANKKWPWSKAKSESDAIRLFEKNYPSVYLHLTQWKTQLQNRDDQGKFWWELRSCAYYEEFEQPKIVYPDIAQHTKFTWDESNAFLGNTAYIIPTDELWLVGLLNSTCIWWYYNNISSIIRGGFVRFIAQYMGTIPIPAATADEKTPIIKHVQAIFNNPDSPDVIAHEAEIDQMVYELYGLTEEEIKIVEGKTA